MMKKSFVLLALALCVTACEDFNRPLGPWIDEQYELMKKVWDVSVSPHSAAVPPGAALQFAAQVNVRADADRRVRWSVSGASDSGTRIDGNGLLTVGSGESPGAALTVTATSVFDPGKSGAALVVADTGGLVVTVTFDANGGTWSDSTTAAKQITVNAGNNVNAPSLGLAKSGYTFAGWSLTIGGAAVAFPYTVTATATLYARWAYTVAGASGWAAAINAANSAAPAPYFIDIGQNDMLLPNSGTSGNPAITGNANITVIGSGTITLTRQGCLLIVPSGAAFTLDGPKLAGYSSNNASVVQITGGTFTMSDGCIRDNHSTNTAGGVDISSGTFIMNGGTITNNTSSGVGGVYIHHSGIFTLNSPATQSSVSGNTGTQQVYVNSGGRINGNAGANPNGW